MKEKKQKALVLLSSLLTALAFIVLLATPINAATEEGCWFEDELTPHGACADNDCWFWQAGQRCKDGGWYGGCECAPLMN